MNRDSQDEPAPAAERALEYVQDGCVVGLGTGRAATSFVRALARRIDAGLRIRGVPTSATTAALARELGVPVVSLDEVVELDVTVDGADEVDPQLDLIKGYGGALVREKIVAASSKHLVILVGKEKLVPALGSRGRLPVEIVPFAEALCGRRLAALGCRPRRRVNDGGSAFVSDNGNYILDCAVEPIGDAVALERAIHAVPGVVGTGLFLGMADVVIAQDGDRVEVLRRK
jgi:ribose 5-phosphate isomerase A